MPWVMAHDTFRGVFLTCAATWKFCETNPPFEHKICSILKTRSALDLFIQCMGSILLQTCRGQWGAVQEWVQGWISKTLRRWKFTSHELVSWWLENIYIGLQVKEYLDNLGVEYRLAELFGRVSKFWPQVLQIWVLSWKRSGSLSPPWRLLGRDQEGLHQGFFQYLVLNRITVSRPCGSTPPTVTSTNTPTAATR